MNYQKLAERQRQIEAEHYQLQPRRTQQARRQMSRLEAEYEENQMQFYRLLLNLHPDQCYHA